MDKQILMLLLEADEAEVGIAIKTSNVTLLRNKIYKLLRENAGLGPFALIVPPTDPESTLWIVKKERSNGQTED